MREHFNDVPGDIVASEAESLPGGFGVGNPDQDVDATVDELVDNDVRSPSGQDFGPTEQRGGDTTGTGYTAAVGDGATASAEDLFGGEEGT